MNHVASGLDRVAWLGELPPPSALTSYLRRQDVGLVTIARGHRLPPARLITLDEVPRSEGVAEVLGCRVAVLDTHAGGVDAIVRALRSRGAEAASVDAQAETLHGVAALVPDALLVDLADLHRSSWDFVRTLWSHPQLRFTPLLLAPPGALHVPQGAEWDPAEMCAALHWLHRDYRRLVSKARSRQEMSLRMDRLGPLRTMRALMEADRPLRVRADTDTLTLYADLVGPLIVGAFGGPRGLSEGSEPEQAPLSGHPALAALLGCHDAALSVRVVERPVVTNIMGSLAGAPRPARSGTRGTAAPERAAPDADDDPPSSQDIELPEGTWEDPSERSRRRAEDRTLIGIGVPSEPKPENAEHFESREPEVTPAALSPQADAVKEVAPLAWMRTPGSRDETPRKSSRPPRFTVLRAQPDPEQAEPVADDSPGPSVGPAPSDSASSSVRAVPSDASASSPRPAPGDASAPSIQPAASDPPVSSARRSPREPSALGAASIPSAASPASAAPAAMASRSATSGSTASSLQPKVPLADDSRDSTSPRVEQDRDTTSSAPALPPRPLSGTAEESSSATVQPSSDPMSRIRRSFALEAGAYILAAIAVLASVAWVASHMQPARPVAPQLQRVSAESARANNAPAGPLAASQAMSADDEAEEDALEENAAWTRSAGKSNARLRKRADEAAQLVSEGNVDLKNGREQAARSRYLQALKLVPGYPRAIAGFARLDIAQGRGRNALKHARRLVRVRPKAGPYWKLLGDAYQSAGMRDQAIAAWTRAKRLGSKSAAARLSSAE